MKIILLLLWSMLKIGCCAFGGRHPHPLRVDAYQKEGVFFHSSRYHFRSAGDALVWNII